MAYTSTPTTPVSIALDEVARGRAGQLVEHVAAAYVPPPQRARGASGEVVDEAYVLTGAVRVGLNHWTLPASPPARPETFFTKPGTGVGATIVHVEDDDLARASALADRLIVPVEAVLSAAACSGLAMLTGDHHVAGPFEA